MGGAGGLHPTLLIGVDGATFTIFDLLMRQGEMPFLREFAGQGVRADLVSTVVPLTPPAWTTLMTGRTPGNHGVIDFIWAEQRATDHYFTLYNFRDIQCETIWSMVSRAGGRVCSLNFPVMAPPPAVSGVVVPGLVSWKHLRRNIHPAGLYEELKGLPDFDPREFAWDFGLEKKAAMGVPAEDVEDWVTFHRRRERHWFDITRHLLGRGRFDLAAILFDGVDKMLHIGWRLLDPAYARDLSPQDAKHRELILGYFRELDGYLEQLCHQAGDETRVVIASDHGFGPSHEVFRVNSWLAREGYLAWRQVGEVDDRTRQSIDRLVERHFVLLDWEKTTAYARTTTSNGIYITVAEAPGGPGVAPAQYGSFRDTLREKLLRVVNPDCGETVVKEVLTREEAYPGANNRQAPDLTLVMRDHGFVSILDKTPVVASRPQVEGTHYPLGVFLARGPGMRKAAGLAPFSIGDITPILLHCLGLPVPEDLEGTVPAGLFAAEHLRAHPLQTGPPTRPPHSYALQTAYATPEEEEKGIMNQMRALGYIE